MSDLDAPYLIGWIRDGEKRRREHKARVRAWREAVETNPGNVSARYWLLVAETTSMGSRIRQRKLLERWERIQAAVVDTKSDNREQLDNARPEADRD
jgi:hypothetical protein